MTHEPAKRIVEDTPPPHPTDETVSDLGFERRKRMVRWLSPTQLFRTGRQALFVVLTTAAMGTVVALAVVSAGALRTAAVAGDETLCPRRS
jgi:hypothetical protein